MRNGAKVTVLEDLELMAISKETHPNLFQEGSEINDVDTTGMYTIADKNRVSFKNTWDSK